MSLDPTSLEKEIEKLLRVERVLLYVYAVNVQSYTLRASHIVSKILSFNNEGVIDKARAQLEKRSFLAKYITSYYDRFSIRPDLRIGVLEYMLTKGGDDAQKVIELIRPYNSGAIYDMLDALRYAINPDKYAKPAYRSSQINLFLNEISLCSVRPWYHRLLSCLSPQDHTYIVLNRIDASVMCDQPYDTDTLDCIFGYTGPNNDLKHDLDDIRALYMYFLDGVYDGSEPLGANRRYQILLRAIRKTNLGEYDDALSLFNYYFKIANKESNIKNMISQCLPEYYLTLAQAHSGKSAERKKLEALLKKKDINSNYILYPALAISSAFTSINCKPNKEYLSLKPIQNIILKAPINNIYVLLRNEAKYFGMSTNVPYSTKLPEFKIIQHECSHSLSIPADVLKALNEAYGDKPALFSIARKEEWEWVMEEVLKTVDAQSKKKGTIKANETRITYCINARERVTPVVQTLLKTGGWSAPKPAPVHKYLDCELSYMTDEDKKIAMALCGLGSPYGRFEFPEIYDCAHLFIDSDRLYYNLPTEENKVLVEECRPEIKVARKGNELQISSNIQVYNGLPHSDYHVFKQSKFHYRVVKVSKEQGNVINRLLSLKNFPASAESAVRSFLTKLEDIVEVKSPLLNSKEIPNIDGSGFLAIKVSPAPYNTFDILVRAHPLSDGALYAQPGQGKKIAYDTVNGKNVRVRRDFDAEIKALGNVTDILDGFGVELNDDFGAILGIDAMLDLIKYARESHETVGIEWPQGKKINIKQANASSGWNVGIKSDNGWFDIEGDVRLDQETVLTIAQMLELVANSKGRYIKLNDDDYIEIDKRLRRQLERIEALATKNRNKLQISTFNAALLDEDALNAEVKFAFDQKLLDLQNDIKNSYALNPEAPKNLKATLRPYQLEGYQWMVRLASWGAGACLADDMGLGKTVQTIAFMLNKASEGPALVVAPASVVPNWVAEIEKFAPDLSVLVLNKADDRKKAIKQAKKYHVVITTYGLLNTEEEALAKKKWTTICLDEAHTIKNRDTKMSQAAMQLQASYRIILTGTPIQNHLGELWNLFRFINPGLLGSYEAFRHKFVNPITQDNDASRRKSLKKIIQPFMLRRTKDEVIDDLPDKTEIVLPVELADDELSMYEAMRMKAAKIIEDADKVDINTLAEITKLRRASCSMALVDESWTGSNSKIQAFLDLVSDFKGDGNRMLVFSQFTSFLDLARAALDKAGERYLYLDGSTPMAKREKIVEEFREGKTPLFLISLKAGGLGLNLPEANYVVHLDPWWNPAIEQQATDRAYRIGQKRNVTVYHLLSKNTIEEKIRRLHRTKRDLADSLLEGTGIAGQLTPKDILELISQEP